MKITINTPRHLIALLIAALLIAACGGSGGATPTPTPTPAEIAAAAGRATRAGQSMRFTITIDGARVYTDATRLFALTRVEGQLRRPDGALATLRVRSVAGVAEIRTVSLAGRQYFTNPINRAWQCLAAGAGFDPLVLFDAQQGLEYILENQLRDVTLVGEEQINGRQTYHLRGMIDGATLAAISGDRIGRGPVTADVWADRETLRLAQLILVDGAGADEPASIWTLTFDEYDAPVDLRAPVECDG